MLGLLLVVARGTNRMKKTSVTKRERNNGLSCYYAYDLCVWPISPVTQNHFNLPRINEEEYAAR